MRARLVTFYRVRGPRRLRRFPLAGEGLRCEGGEAVYCVVIVLGGANRVCALSTPPILDLQYSIPNPNPQS